MVRLALSFALLLLALPASAQPAPAQPTPDGRLKAIADSKTIRIAHRTDAMPFAYHNERKEAVGYAIDVCRFVVDTIDRELGGKGLKIEWVPTTTQDRFDVVASGKADMECGSSTITLERLKQVDFSSIIFVETTGLLVRNNGTIQRATDLAGRKVAVIAGTTTERVVAALKSAGRLDITAVPVKDNKEAAAFLEEGKVDAFAHDKLLLAGTQVKDARTVIILPEDLSFEPYGIVLPRNDSGFRLAVNTGLARLYRGGAVVDLFRKWFDPIGLKAGPLLLAAYQLGALSD
jgi:glutamate/aspartate transport system substrate-binding protein